MRKSGIAHASGRIRPFPLVALPISYSCKRNLSGKNSPKKVEETERHRPSKQKTSILTYKHSKSLK
jgi:hypothetical protein